MRIQTHFFSMQFHHKIDNNENGGQFMCGIIGYAGLCNISNSVLIEGLEALEYRAMTLPESPLYMTARFRSLRQRARSAF